MEHSKICDEIEHIIDPTFLPLIRKMICQKASVLERIGFDQEDVREYFFRELFPEHYETLYNSL